MLCCALRYGDQRRAATQQRLLGHVVGGDYAAAHALALKNDLGAARRSGGSLDANAASALTVAASVKRLLGRTGADARAASARQAMDIARGRLGATSRVTVALLASTEPKPYPLRKVDSENVFPFDEPQTDANAAVQLQRTWRGHAGRCRWFTESTAKLQAEIAAQVEVCDRSSVDMLSSKLRQRCNHALAQSYTDISGTCILRGKLRRFTFVCMIELSELKKEVQTIRDLCAQQSRAVTVLQSLLRRHQGRREARLLRLRQYPMAVWDTDLVLRWLEQIQLPLEAARELAGNDTCNSEREARAVLLQLCNDHSIDGSLLQAMNKSVASLLFKDAPCAVSVLLSERDRQVEETAAWAARDALAAGIDLLHV